VLPVGPLAATFARLQIGLDVNAFINLANRRAGGTVQNIKEVLEGKQSYVIVDAIFGADWQIS
jgi:hypothetical protein